VKHLRVFSVVLATLLGGCGFHLAGRRPLPEPLRSTYIEVIAPYRVSEPPLEVSLRSLLQRRGGVVQDSAGAANAVIRLSNLNESRQVLSIGTDGKVLEFQLVTRVTYQVNSGDKVLMPPGTLSLSRSYSFNAQQVLAKDAEEVRLREYIQHELADLLLLRMESVLGRESGLLPAPPGSPVAAPASSAPPPPFSPAGASSNSPGAATPR
jgi:LPS-assembly lipoprotein